MDGTRLAQLISARGLGLGLPLTSLPVTSSTNDLALRAARNDTPHGATFLAEKQTQGRGRRGRNWNSRPGESLTFSVLLRSPMSAGCAQALPLVAGLAVREAIARRLTQAAKIKWPNDIWCEGKKLAGILVESLVRGSALEAVVVGVGINVGMVEFGPELQARATSMALLGASSLDREELLVDVLAELEKRLEAFAAGGLLPLMPELQTHDGLRGEQVRVGAITGRASGIDEQGALVLSDEQGGLHRVSSGSVEPLGGLP